MGWTRGALQKPPISDETILWGVTDRRPLRPICPSDTPRFRPVMGVFRLANAQDEQNCKSTNVNRHEQERSSGDQVSKLPLSTRATAIAVPGSGAAVGVPRLLTEVIQHGTAPSAP